MTKLKRFQGMSTKILIHLYTTLIRPIIEYPVISTCLASNKNLIEMQTIQNRMLKFATQSNNDYDNMTMQEVHENLDIEQINIRLYKLANKAWNRFSQMNTNLANKSLDLNNNPNERDLRS